MVHFNLGKMGKKIFLSLGGQDINQDKSMRYLGMTITDLLSWNPHINEKLAKCRFLLQKSKAIVGRIGD